MIVVVGQPSYRVTDQGPSVDGMPARIALAAAANGRSVQLVGKAGEDPEGDAVVLALARGGVGHVALLRDAGRPTKPDSTALDAADIDLALRYVSEFTVLVLAEPADPGGVRVVTDAASGVGARLIVVVGPGDTMPVGLPPDAIVFEAPNSDPDGDFGSLVGSFASAVDDGSDPAEAFRSSIEAKGWTASTNG